MTTEKRRAAWWWIDRWRKSTAFTDFSLAEQGAYRNLLDELWLRDGVLPQDERILAKICGDATQWKRVREAVLSRFYLTDKGYRNATHDEVAAGVNSFRETQARKGKAGADARWHGRANGRANGPGNDRKHGLPSPYPLTDLTTQEPKGIPPLAGGPNSLPAVAVPDREAVTSSAPPAGTPVAVTKSGRVVRQADPAAQIQCPSCGKSGWMKLTDSGNEYHGPSYVCASYGAAQGCGERWYSGDKPEPRWVSPLERGL